MVTASPPLTRRQAWKRLEKRAGNHLLRACRFIARITPARWESSLGRLLGICCYRLSRRYRNIAVKNIGLVYPEMSPAERHHMARQVFINSCKTAVEFLRLPGMPPEALDRKVHLAGQEHLDTALACGKGVLLISAHFGNWELMAAKLTREGYPLDVLVRDTELRSTTDVLTSTRESTGMRVFSRQAILPAVLALRRNRILAILPDQHELTGIFINFLGHPAKTPIGPAAIALKTGAMLLPVFTFRQPDDTLLVQCYPPFAAEPTGDKTADTRALTEKIMGIIQERIREAPDQWLWLHDRWKSSPPPPTAEASTPP